MAELLQTNLLEIPPRPHHPLPAHAEIAPKLHSAVRTVMGVGTRTAARRLRPSADRTWGRRLLRLSTNAVPTASDRRVGYRRERSGPALGMGVPRADTFKPQSVQCGYSKRRTLNQFDRLLRIDHGSAPRAERAFVGDCGWSKDKGPRRFDGVPCTLGTVSKKRCLMPSPLSPDSPSCLHDHPHARSGRNRGNCDAQRQHHSQKVTVVKRRGRGYFERTSFAS